MTDYEQKYIKYKQKYLDLKDKIERDRLELGKSPFVEIGGVKTSDKPVISIVVTHSARLRCLMDILFFDLMASGIRALKNKKINEIRFQNGCILKLEINYRHGEHLRNKIQYSLEMIYSGSVRNKKPGAYFVSPQPKGPKPDEIPFPTIRCPGGPFNIDPGFVIHGEALQQWLYNQYTGTTEFSLKKSTQSDKHLPPQKHTIYIIRHGESAHNVRRINFENDTTLTEYGESETGKTGLFLSRVLDSPGTPRSEIYYFASDLKRTRQTMAIISGKLVSDKFTKPNKIIILPCSTELRYVAGVRGTCYHTNSRKFIPFENRVTCKSQCASDCINDKVAMDKLCCCAEGNLKIDWYWYNTFYNGKSVCHTNTNFLYQLIQIVNIGDKH